MSIKRAPIFTFSLPGGGRLAPLPPISYATASMSKDAWWDNLSVSHPFKPNLTWMNLFTSWLTTFKLVLAWHTRNVNAVINIPTLWNSSLHVVFGYWPHAIVTSRHGAPNMPAWFEKFLTRRGNIVVTWQYFFATCATVYCATVIATVSIKLSYKLFQAKNIFIRLDL